MSRSKQLPNPDDHVWVNVAPDPQCVWLVWGGFVSNTTISVAFSDRIEGERVLFNAGWAADAAEYSERSMSLCLEGREVIFASKLYR